MNHTAERVLAIDLGATSIRVTAVDLGAATPEVDVVHRYPHGPVRHPDGSLRWDWERLEAEVERGLEAGLEAGPVASIGIDGWGVDYGLVDAAGNLLSPPVSYRDARTESWSLTAERIGVERLYATTGIQLMPVNSVFQLAAHDPRELGRAHRLLMLPDLLLRRLTGTEVAERSNASTTGLLDIRTGAWSVGLLESVGVDPGLMAPVTTAPKAVGTWRGTPVHLVGSHDTASAFLGVPGVPGPGTAIVSSGTWVPVGSERREPDTSETARIANFSNEAGALGGVRFLKNVVGFWLLEQCRILWGRPPVEELVAAASEVTGSVPLVVTGDPRFLSPTDMEAEIRSAAGLGASASRAVVVRCALESIAAGTAAVVGELGAVTGSPVTELMVVGGAVRIGLMNELYERHTGLPVVVGSPEAATLGNAVVQGIALGRFRDVDEARRWLAGGARRV